MVVRLQTAEGKIKEYQTIKGVGNCIGGEVSGIEKWITKCGREWDRLPEPHQECCHLECAIDKADIWKLYAMATVFFGSITVISFYIINSGPNVIISFPFAVLAIILLVLALEEKKCWNELNEFKNKETINGIKAWQISENPELAKCSGWLAVQK